MNTLRLIPSALILSALSLVAPGMLAQSPDGALPSASVDALLSEVTLPDWIVKQSDNICGLTNARQLSNPGVVDFSSLYDSTPEARKIKDEGIDPNSPEGSQLRAAAFERIRKAAVQVMNDKGLCSVWKKIRSRSGNAPTDITESVRGLL